MRVTLFWLAMSLLICASVPMFVDRPELARATAAYSKNPSPENAAAVVREQKKTQAVREDAQILIFVGLWAPGLLVYGLYRGSQRQFGRRRITF
jgi:hypothetical protein